MKRGESVLKLREFLLPPKKSKNYSVKKSDNPLERSLVDSGIQLHNSLSAVDHDI